MKKYSIEIEYKDTEIGAFLQSEYMYVVAESEEEARSKARETFNETYDMDLLEIRAIQVIEVADLDEEFLKKYNFKLFKDE